MSLKGWGVYGVVYVEGKWEIRELFTAVRLEKVSAGKAAVRRAWAFFMSRYGGLAEDVMFGGLSTDS